MKSAVVLLVSMFAVSPARADRVGNGGGLWSCQDRFQQMKFGELVDLYEAREEFGVSIVSTSSRDPFQIADDVARRLENEWPELASRLKPSMNEVRGSMRLVDSVLVVIDDALYRLTPHPRTCAGGEWEYVQFANFTPQNQVLIRRDLWQDDAISPLNKAALLWHEAVYRWMRLENGDKDSVRTRQIVGYLFANWPMSRIRAAIEKVIVPPAPMKGFACSIDNGVNHLSYLGLGESDAEARFAAKDACQAGPQPFHCRESAMICDEFQEGRASWFCEAKNRLTRKAYSAKGRSRVEAAASARIACQKEGQPFHCEREASCSSRP